MSTVTPTGSHSGRLATHKPRLLLVEHHALFAESLRVRLRLDYVTAALVVDQWASTTDSVLRDPVLATAPDVAVVCLDLGPLVNADAVISRLTGDRVPVVAVTETSPAEEPDLWSRAFRAGVREVVSKADSLSVLDAALARAQNGSAPAGRSKVERSVVVAVDATPFTLR